ncbi:hypothetical protein [Xanthomonas phaseoli]|nr:hypothetical protein [Xanthomonas phaseoli]
MSGFLVSIHFLAGSLHIQFSCLHVGPLRRARVATLLLEEIS